MATRTPAAALPWAIAAAVLAAIALSPDPSPDPSPERVERSVPPEEATPTVLRRVALPPPPAVARPPAPAAPTPAGSVPPTAGAVIRPEAADAGRGRLLLARVEAGRGPGVEIAWPEEPEERRQLLVHLTRCAGWQAMLLADGRLWRLEDPAGRAWAPGPAARPSGILRDLEGAAIDAVRVAAIRSRHGVAGGRPVATVDRRWDARLLGGLDRLIDAGGVGWGSVRGRYRADAGRLLVTALRVDDRPLPGRLDLGPIARCAR